MTLQKLDVDDSELWWTLPCGTALLCADELEQYFRINPDAIRIRMIVEQFPSCWIGTYQFIKPHEDTTVYLECSDHRWNRVYIGEEFSKWIDDSITKQSGWRMSIEEEYWEPI